MDLESILAPVSPEDPCGADVEYNPAFAEIDRLAQGKPEQQIGSTIVPASDPDWKLLERQSAELLGKSKDLRVAAHLTKALLRNDGWVGFSKGLALLRGLVERYWEGVYPRLDPGDDNDPTMRINVLTSIADPAVLTAVRLTPLVASRSVGRFSLKDLEIASGEAPPPATGEAPTLAAIDGAVMDCDLTVLTATVASLQACRESLAGLEAAIVAQVSAADAPNFGKLPAMLRKAEMFLGAKVAERAPATPGADGAGAGATNGEAAGRGGGAAPRAFAGAVASRDDVVKALDAICTYYAKHEPSSPIPIFMERCKRMVMMSFVDIVKELVPDAVSKLDVLRGNVE